MGWRASPAGTARRKAITPFPWRSIVCWSSALSAICRPNCGAALRLTALLHDAAEYVIGDLISPFKTAIGLDYKAFENRLLTRDPCPLRLARPKFQPPMPL